MAQTDPIGDACPHCGAPNAKRLGRCEVCELLVCERCGNTQFVQGERKLVHDSCLHNAGDTFSMIRFIR